MMILRTSAASPFGRKIAMAIAVLGLGPRISPVHADTIDASDSLRQQNPLGKIPTLLLDSGEAVFDSRVIAEYLNELDGRNVLIPAGAGRIAALRQQALADGLMDAAILQMYEKRFRPPEHHVPTWIDHQQGKVLRALDHAERALATPGSGLPHIGEIAQAAALGYLDFRFAGAWRAAHPALVNWLDDFARRTPAFAQTTPQG
jgi:glutathione S-transferase